MILSEASHFGQIRNCLLSSDQTANVVFESLGFLLSASPSFKRREPSASVSFTDAFSQLEQVHPKPLFTKNCSDEVFIMLVQADTKPTRTT